MKDIPPAWRTVFFRWIDILFLALLVYLMLILALNYFYPDLSNLAAIFEHLGLLFQWTVFTTAFTLLWLFIIRLGGFPSVRSLFFRPTLRYPPFWFAVPVAVILWTISPCMEKVRWKAFPAPLPSDLVFPFLVLFSGAVAAKAASGLRNPSKRRSFKKTSQEQRNECRAPPSSPDVIMKWIEDDMPIQTVQEDFFERAPIAERIARTLSGSQGTTTCLVGPFGSGKSSILNLVEQNLDRKTVLAKVSGWGLQQGSSAEIILRAAIQGLSFHVDCLALHRLPAQYQLAVGTGPWWWKALSLSAFSSSDPIEVLATIDEILTAVDINLIIFLEDIDRNWQQGALWTEVVSLLDRLKKLRRVSYVLAIAETIGAGSLISRIADHVEVVPAIPADTISKIYLTFSRECRKASDDLDVYEEDKRLARMGVFGSEYVATLLGTPMARAIRVFVDLIAQPRNLKHVLRRTRRMWRSLHGEIDFEDVFAGNVLRVTVPEVLEFVNANIQSIRALRSTNEREGGDQIRKGLHEKLDRHLSASAAERPLAEKVIEFLFPHWGKRFAAKPEVIQGVAQLPEPTDYWNRFAEEYIPRGELRDQEVMRAIRVWKASSDKPAYGQLTLAEAMVGMPSFPEKVSQFGDDLLDGRDVRILAGELFVLAYIPDKPLREPRQPLNDVPGEAEMLRLARAKSFPGHGEWVLGEAFKLLKFNLSAATHVYEQWLHPLLQPDQDEVKRLRDAFLSNARDRYSNVDTFIRAVRYSAPAAIKRFLGLLCQSQYGSGQYVPAEWKWLAECLVAAAKIDQTVIVPQIAILGVDEEFTPPENTLRWNQERLRMVFQENEPEVMLLLTRINPDQFEDEVRRHLAFAREEARKWVSQQQEQV